MKCRQIKINLYKFLYDLLLNAFTWYMHFIGAVRPACHIQTPHCPSQPCMHGGHCVEGWNRFHCDCTGTSYIGPTCGKGAYKI